MARYEITAPDGSVYEIEAPEGATEQDAIAYLQAQHDKPQGFQNSVGRIPKPNPNAVGADPTEGMSNLELGWAGAGKSLADTWRGIRQLGAAGADAISPNAPSLGGLITGADPSRSAALTAEADQARAGDAALMSRPAGLLGNVAGQIGQLAIPVGDGAKALSLLGKAAPYVKTAAASGLFSALQPVTTGETRLGNTAMGAAAGLGGQALAGVTKAGAVAAKNAFSDTMKQSIAGAKAAGIPLHLSQVTNSRSLKGLSSVLGAVPFTGAGKAARAQQDAFNAAVGRSFGAKANSLSDQVMAQARGEIGQGYDDIFARNNVDLQPQHIRQLLAVEKSAQQDLTADQADLVSRQVQKVIDEFQGGQISGPKYQALRGSLADAADTGKTGAKIKALRKALDEAAGDSVGPQDSAALKKLNSQYANMRLTEKALSQVSGAGGDVRPASLFPLVKNGSTKEMRELAKIGQNVLKDPVPNSGTPEREMWLRAFGLGGGGAGAGVALGVLPLLAKSAGAGVLLGRALNSPKAAGLLGQGRPMAGLARAAQPFPKLLPASVFAYLNSDPQQAY